jgi:iron complex outermembrane receptor protein
LRLNAAMFFSEATNQQQGTQEFDASGAIWFRTVNTGKSEYRGLELETLWSPVDDLEIEASVGYIHYDRVDPGRSGLCRKRPDGSLCPAPRTPEWTAAFGATYTWGLTNGGALSLRGDATYTSEMFFGTDPFNGFQDPLTLVDARLTWESPNQSWSMALFGTNLTDEVYFNGMLSLVTVLGREQGNVAPPREYGVTFRRSF